MTVTLGWWLLPLLATLILFGWAFYPRGERQTSDYDFTFWIPAAFRIGGATIASLVAWLIWSLAR